MGANWAAFLGFALPGAIVMLASSCVAGGSRGLPPSDPAHTLSAVQFDKVSCQHPVVLEASIDHELREAEAAWLDARSLGQTGYVTARFRKKHRIFDVFRVMDADDHPLTVCFDVTDWFGA